MEKLPEGTSAGFILEFIYWIGGILSGTWIVLFGWINNRLNKKMSKDVFEQFEKRNDEQHAHTENDLKKQDEKLDKILDKLEGKKDKDAKC